jgi:hypothetical protein
MKNQELTATKAYDIASSVDLQISFNTKNVTHTLKSILEIIEHQAINGYFSTSDYKIKLNIDLIESIKSLGYKIDCKYVDSPMSCGKKILIGHIISWDKIKNDTDQ